MTIKKNPPKQIIIRFSMLLEKMMNWSGGTQKYLGREKYFGALLRFNYVNLISTSKKS